MKDSYEQPELGFAIDRRLKDLDRHTASNGRLTTRPETFEVHILVGYKDMLLYDDERICQIKSFERASSEEIPGFAALSLQTHGLNSIL